VDDDTDVAVGLALVLARLGHNARRAHNADAALAAVRDWTPRAVIPDLGLPGRRRYGVARPLGTVVSPRPRLVAPTGDGAGWPPGREAGRRTPASGCGGRCSRGAP